MFTRELTFGPESVPTVSLPAVSCCPHSRIGPPAKLLDDFVSPFGQDVADVYGVIPAYGIAMQRLCIDAASIAVCCIVGQSTRRPHGDVYWPMMAENGDSLVANMEVVWRGPSHPRWLEFCQEVRCLTRDV